MAATDPIKKPGGSPNAPTGGAGAGSTLPTPPVDADTRRRMMRGDQAEPGETDGSQGIDESKYRTGRAVEVGGKGVERAGQAMKGAGNVTQAAGKATKAVGAVGQAAGAATELAGKGLSAAGTGVSAVGKALAATKVGAIVGAPLMALGGAAKGAGKGVEGVGKGVKGAGRGVRSAGEKVDQAGKKVKDTGEKTKQKGQELQQAGQELQQEALEDGDALGDEPDDGKRKPLWARSAQAERMLAPPGAPDGGKVKLRNADGSTTKVPGGAFGGGAPGGVGSVGEKMSKTAKASARMAGKTMKYAGKGVQVGGKAIQYTGKGISAAGTGISTAGRALSATGVGAIVGVPLMGAGLGIKAGGKGAEYGGRGIGGIGKGITGAGKRLEQAGSKSGSGPLGNRSQVAGLLVLLLLYSMLLMTWGHSIYPILFIYFIGGFSKFMRRWIPPLGTVFDPFARTAVLRGSPATPSIGPRIAETLALMLMLMCVMAFDLLWIGAIVGVLYALQQVCDTPVIGLACDVIEAISKVFN